MARHVERSFFVFLWVFAVVVFFVLVGFPKVVGGGVEPVLSMKNGFCLFLGGVPTYVEPNVLAIREGDFGKGRRVLPVPGKVDFGSPWVGVVVSRVFGLQFVLFLVSVRPCLVVVFLLPIPSSGSSSYAAVDGRYVSFAVGVRGHVVMMLAGTLVPAAGSSLRSVRGTVVPVSRRALVRFGGLPAQLTCA